MKKLLSVFIGLITVFMIVPAAGAEVITHQVSEGDTLWDISGKYLSSPWKWPLVWANNQDITNPHLIYPDDLVIISKDKDGTTIKIIPADEDSPERTTYTPMEVKASKEKSIVLSPQYSSFIYTPDKLEGDGNIISMENGADFASLNDSVIIKLNPETMPGKRLAIASRVSEIKVSKKKTEGYLYKMVGLADVDEILPGAIKATIAYANQEIKSDDIIINDPRVLQPRAVDISEPVKNIRGKIIGLYGGVSGTSSLDLIFTDLGEADGIKAGSILNIASEKTLPDQEKTIITENRGMALVIQTLQGSSMGIILESNSTIEKDFIVKGD